MGRPRKPTALRILQGNAGRRPLPEGEPKPNVGAEPPDWLSLEDRKQWDKWAPRYIRLGILTELDTPAFAAWMIALAQLALLRSEGEPVPCSLLDIVKSYAMQFGGTGAARSKVHVAKPEEKSKLSKYTGGV